MKKEDGKKHFYQWEQKQKIIVEEECTLVLYSNGTLTEPLGCEVKEDNGIRFAEVPNILLQTAAQLHAYAWNEETTSVIGHDVFSVIPMPKPIDYIYTETEHITIENMIEQALEKVEQKIKHLSQGKSAKYNITKSGWYRVLNIIRGSTGTVNFAIATGSGNGADTRMTHSLSLDICGWVDYPNGGAGEPIIIKRYENMLGEAQAVSGEPVVSITQVRMGYPDPSAEYEDGKYPTPDSDGDYDEAKNPINCYLDIYVEFDEAKYSKLWHKYGAFVMNFAGFSDNHNCVPIEEPTEATDTGMYGEALLYYTAHLSELKRYTTTEELGYVYSQFNNYVPYSTLISELEGFVTKQQLSDGKYYYPGNLQFATKYGAYRENSSGFLTIYGADKTLIDEGTNKYRPITPSHIQYAVEKYAQPLVESMHQGAVPYGKELPYTWAELSEKIKSGDFTGISIGDYKTITLTTGENVVCEVAGIDQYYGHTFEHHIDFISRDCLAGLELQYNEDVLGTISNNGKYEQKNPFMASKLYEALNNTTDGIITTLPQDLRNIITYKYAYMEARWSGSSTIVGNNTGLVWCKMGPLWLPTEFEVWGTHRNSEDGIYSLGEGSNIQYPIFKNGLKHIVKHDVETGIDQSWWVASAARMSTSNFCDVSANGDASSVEATSYKYVPLCFRIG